LIVAGFQAGILGAGSRPARPPRSGDPEINQGIYFKVTFQTDTMPPLDSRERKQNNVLLMFQNREAGMLKIFVEEAAALASITLFVGMIAVWAQLIPQL
jgi:hypothetical protein